MDKQKLYLQHILNAVHGLDLHTMRLHTSEGQFNDVVIVNDELVFRFPKTLHEVNNLVQEVEVLSKIQNRTTLAIPKPMYVRTNSGVVNENFMAYRMISGQPLAPNVLGKIKDELVLEWLATQVAEFLQELHAIPAKDVGMDLPLADTHDEWQDLYQQFHDRLFPYMRVDACETVARMFETFLNEPGYFDYVPVFRHGDFGGSNILYDPFVQKATGVIDFSSASLGDPALDIASISCTGDAFFQRMSKKYPGIGLLMERAQFYKSTFALQEALYGLRDNDQESFKSGIAQYI